MAKRNNKNSGEYYFLSLLRAYLKDQTSQPPETLSDLNEGELVSLARKEEIEVHFLKRLDNPRIQKPIGILKSIYPRKILDIGPGPGKFLWHFLEEFPRTQIFTCDHRFSHAQWIGKIARIANLPIWSICGNGEYLPVMENRFPVVTMFEVLEHTLNPESMIMHAGRVSSDWVLASVPSKPDGNPEHIHLFDREQLRSLFSIQNLHVGKIDQDSRHFYILARNE